jgi:hypothetical protein
MNNELILIYIFLLHVNILHSLITENMSDPPSPYAAAQQYVGERLHAEEGSRFRQKTFMIAGGILLGIVIILLVILTAGFKYPFGEALGITGLTAGAFATGFGVSFLLRGKFGKKLAKKALFKKD